MAHAKGKILTLMELSYVSCERKARAAGQPAPLAESAAFRGASEADR